MGIKTKKNVGAIVLRNGVSFRVWAPFASQVSVIGSFNNWIETPLESENDGYWSATLRDARAGQEYKFVIHNGDQVFIRNDPRALHFTTSAGNSVIARSGFDWGEDDFTPPPLDQQVIYELHVGTFNRPEASINGTFADLIDKLDYLAELGINMIELMPVSSMLMDRGWGYAIDYIFSVESLYGGRHGFMQFVKTAHDRGIGVILDVVYNHFGPDENLDLWDFDGWHEDGKGGIYFYNDWRAETPWGNTRPDFGRPEVRQYILDNIKMWMHDCRVDGLRVDSTAYIRNVLGANDDPEHDLPEGWLLLQQINSIAHKINPQVITIAEDIAYNDYLTKPIKDGGAGFNSQWELNFPFALRDALKSNNPDAINMDNICAQLTKNFNGDPLQRIIFADSHDSAANGNSRLVEVISPGNPDSLFARQQTLIAATLLLSTPGIPMLFQGQELMQGGTFNDWEGVDWSRAAKHQGIVSAFTHLIALKKNAYGVSLGLSGNNINILSVDQNNKVLVYHRWKNGGPKDDTIVVVNFSSASFKDYRLSMPRDGLWKVRFNSTWSGYSGDFKNVSVDIAEAKNSKTTIVLPPACGLIFSQDD